MIATNVSRRSCLLPVADVAWLLGMDSSQVCRAIRLGRLPVVRRRGRVLVPARALAHLAGSGDSRVPAGGEA
jgi:hypothetical protein